LLRYYGFYKLWQVLQRLSGNNSFLIAISAVLLLLPNLHLWTSLIGKEALLFTALVLIADSVMSRRFTGLKMLAAFALIVVIRPHIAVVLLSVFMIAYLWKGRAVRKQKFLMALVLMGLLLVSYLLLDQIAAFGDNPWRRLMQYYEHHINVLKHTRSYVPLDQYTLPLKLFTFYFRPLLMDRNGFLYTVWGLENILILSLCIFALYRFLTKTAGRRLDFFSTFSLCFLLLYGLLYVFGYANYGLIARTRAIVLPFVYILIVKALASASSSAAAIRGSSRIG